MESIRVAWYGEVPVVRNFHCSKCGILVFITDRKDKRVRFCCVECEKKFWRHEYRRHNTPKRR